MSGSSSIKHRHQAVLLLVSAVHRCMTPQCLAVAAVLQDPQNTTYTPRTLTAP